MAIQKVISYIDTLLSHYDHKKNHCKQTRLFCHVLENLSKQLKKCKGPDEIEELCNVLKFLERIPFEGFLKDRLFGEVLAINDYQTYYSLTQLGQLQATTPPLISKFEHELGSIHVTLAKYLRFLTLYPQAWRFQYDLKNGEEMLHDNENPIAKWQHAATTLSTDATRAIRDFLRDITFRGSPRETKTPENIQSKLIEFVNAAYGYSEGEKKLILDWLCRNGGQINNRFVDRLIESTHFMDRTDADDIWQLAASEALEQHWYLEQGKIHLSCDILVKQLRQGVMKMMYANPNSNALDDVKIAEDFEELENLSKEKLKPLLRLNADIALDIGPIPTISDSNKSEPVLGVIPTMVGLDVTGFNNQLKSPERFMRPKEEQERHSAFKKINA